MSDFLSVFSIFDIFTSLIPGMIFLTLFGILLPTDNVYFVSGQYGGWNENLLIPSIYKTPEAFANGASSYVGRTMRILMPIMIENVQNDYTFEFKINSLLNPELGVSKK